MIRLFWLFIFLVFVSSPESFAQKTKRLIYGVHSRVTSLNPYLLSGIDSYTITGFVIEPLARIEPYTQTLQPALAESWVVDEKAKTIRVTLRKNVRFHNGQEFSAEDVYFTWSSFFKPEYKGEIWRGMWDKVEDVKVIDSHSVEFKMTELSYQQFKNIMTSMRILPREYYGVVQPREWARKLYGTGPFKTARFESGRALELDLNPNWWGWEEFKLKKASALLIKHVPDAKLAEQMMLKGELHLFEIPSGEAYLGKLPVHEAQSAFGRGLSIGMNLEGVLKDQRLRKALLFLWNRESLNEKVFSKKMSVSLDTYSALMPYYPKKSPVKYDLRAAQKLLAEIGHTEGKEISLKMIVHRAPDERWVSLFQTDARKLGIIVRIERVEDEAQWWRLLKEKKYDLAAFDGANSEAPHPTVVHSKGSYNNSGFSNQDVDRALDELEKEFNLRNRHKMYRDLIASIRDLHIELPGLHTNSIYFMASPDVTLDSKHPHQSWRWGLKD